MADLIEMDPIDFKHFKPLSKKRSNGKRNVPKDENPTDPFGFPRGSLQVSSRRFLCMGECMSAYCARIGITSCLGSHSSQIYKKCRLKGSLIVPNHCHPTFYDDIVYHYLDNHLFVKMQEYKLLPKYNQGVQEIRALPLQTIQTRSFRPF